MTLVVPSAAEVEMLAQLVSQSLSLRLFVNDYTPALGDTAASYAEPSGLGYAPKALSPAGWAVSAGPPAVVVYPEQTWTFTGAVGNVYGYFVVDTATGGIRWAERFTDGPFLFRSVGSQLKIPPTFQWTSTGG